MPKNNQQGFTPPIIVLLVVLIGGAVALYLVLNPTFFKPKASSPAPQVTIPAPLTQPSPATSSQSSYTNPFDASSSSQYSNPFTTTQNPFDGLQ